MQLSRRVSCVIHQPHRPQEQRLVSWKMVALGLRLSKWCRGIYPGTPGGHPRSRSAYSQAFVLNIGLLSTFQKELNSRLLEEMVDSGAGNIPDEPKIACARKWVSVPKGRDVSAGHMSQPGRSACQQKSWIYLEHPNKEHSVAETHGVCSYP